ncbi:hypothetical protein FOZ63_017737, partial [Perkinsus olseni]
TGGKIAAIRVFTDFFLKNGTWRSFFFVVVVRLYRMQPRDSTVTRQEIISGHDRYCDFTSTVSPADIIGIRGLFLGVLVFLLTYIVAVLTIRTAFKRVMTTHAAELSILEPQMNDVREDMHSVVERRWCGLPVVAGPPHDFMDHNGPKFETGSLLELVVQQVQLLMVGGSIPWSVVF